MNLYGNKMPLFWENVWSLAQSLLLLLLFAYIYIYIYRGWIWARVENQKPNKIIFICKSSPKARIRMKWSDRQKGTSQSNFHKGPNYYNYWGEELSPPMTVEERIMSNQFPFEPRCHLPLNSPQEAQKRDKHH